MPVRMVGAPRLPSSGPSAPDPYLTTLHTRGRSRKALQAALLLESLVPWELSLSAELLLPAEDASHADRVGLTEQTLLELVDRGGEAAISRGATIFAACDRGRDGGLDSVELFLAIEAISEDVRACEALPPEEIKERALEELDAATATAWAHHSEDCLELLHEISLLRLLVPPPVSARGRLARQQGQASGSVRAISAAAAARARGGAAGRQEAAAQAIEDALAAERSRVRQTVSERGDVRLLPFLQRFVGLVSDLAAGQAEVGALARAYQAQLEEAVRVAAEEAAPDLKERERAAAAAAEAERRRRREEANVGELQRLIERASLHGGASEQPADEPAGFCGASPCSVSSAGRSCCSMASPSSGGPSSAGLSSCTGLSGSSAGRAGVVRCDSAWAPRVELKYFERAGARRRHGVGRLMDSIDPEPEPWAMAWPPAGAGSDSSKAGYFGASRRRRRSASQIRP